MVILTGAGISAESGIPTFRGPEGFWTVGSKNYHPMELATYQAFNQMPETVWDWYHHRRKICAAANPNAGHYAVLSLQNIFLKCKKSFHLVTQNVDGLHLRAGSNSKLVYQIHGNINYMRCFEECSNQTYIIPQDTIGIPSCPLCGHKARPHVLWFDESYNEQFYKYNSAMNLVRECDLLIIIGTTLQTNLPYKMVVMAEQRNIPIIFIDPNPQNVLNEFNMIMMIGQSGILFPNIVNEVEKVLNKI